jgi:hypothetical protein
MPGGYTTVWISGIADLARLAPRLVPVAPPAMIAGIIPHVAERIALGWAIA